VDHLAVARTGAGADGPGTSSRNSEVIHAGIYYPAGSLKARLCVQGRERLYAYCAERGIGHRRCGKLIVAHTPGQVAALPAIAAKARANGVADLQLLGADEARGLEPALACAAALLSPSTGIVDSHGLMLALQGDLEQAGGLVACHSTVQRLRVVDGGIELHTADGTALRARTLVNAAGLGACALAARIEGLSPAFVPRPWFAKGSYFTLAGRAPFQRLVYPAPEPERHLAGLGVHLTLDLPKISGPHEPAADFRIDGPAQHGVPGLVNLLGIESPGLTSSLAIGEHVAGLLATQEN